MCRSAFGTKRPPVQIRPPRPESQATRRSRQWPLRCRCYAVLVRVVGQAPRARRIKTASEESPSRRRSQSSSTFRAARIGPHPRGADVCHLDHGDLPRPGPSPPFSPGNHVSARPGNPAAIRISDNPHPAPIPARAHNSRPRITRAAPSPPRVTHPRLAESMGVALYRFFGLLQNRIPAKMISAWDPDWPSSRPVLPTSGAKGKPPQLISPTGSSRQWNLQRPV